MEHCTRHIPLFLVHRVCTTLGDTVGMFQPVALDTVHTESPFLGVSSLPAEAVQLDCPQAYCILSPSTLLPTLGEACLQCVSPTIEHLHYPLSLGTVVVLGLYTLVAGICWDQPPSIQPPQLLHPLPVSGLVTHNRWCSHSLVVGICSGSCPLDFCSCRSTQVRAGCCRCTSPSSVFV